VTHGGKLSAADPNLLFRQNPTPLFCCHGGFVATLARRMPGFAMASTPLVTGFLLSLVNCADSGDASIFKPFIFHHLFVSSV